MPEFEVMARENWALICSQSPAGLWYSGLSGRELSDGQGLYYDKSPRGFSSLLRGSGDGFKRAFSGVM